MDNDEEDVLDGCDCDDVKGCNEIQDIERVNEKDPLVLNSSVAFGTSDYHDFEVDGCSDAGVIVQAALNLCSTRSVDEITKTESNNNLAVARWNAPDESLENRDPGVTIAIGSDESSGFDFHGDSGDSFFISENMEIISNPHLDRLQVVSNLPAASCSSQDSCDAVSRIEVPPTVLHDSSKLSAEDKIENLHPDGYKKMSEGESVDSITYNFRSAKNFKEHCDLNGANSSISEHLVEENSSTSMSNHEVSNHRINEFDDEIVTEMEKILLDVKQPIYPMRIQNFQSNQSSLLRDGGLSASTSSVDEFFSPFSHSSKLDRVEVIGAKQRRGDISFSERMVGVKEYTMYVIKVWNNEDSWIVERRYREFYTLYCCLKSYFSDHGWTLPSPWLTIEQESWKVFGSSSPEVISQRSVLIQECLNSIIRSDSYTSLPHELNWFLSHSTSTPRSPTSLPQSSGSTSSLGRTISLIVDVLSSKSTKQILETQQYKCAGCHHNFHDGLTAMRGFVQKLGWGKPRLCEYTGQLFCSSCHANDYAVLPGMVLHHWDFTHYPVSRLAKSYLDSIHEQPMLCISAVNPFLFSKVPVVRHATNLRKHLGSIVQYVRCPFRVTINKGLASRRYLLETNDFFALRDLIDLSRGAFSVLPLMLETTVRKITEHITEHCLICYDVGVPCNAGQICPSPTLLIFPFQENQSQKCRSCGSLYHIPCFQKQKRCSCGIEISK